MFKYDGFLFVGHAHRYLIDATSIYNVKYALFDSPYDLEVVQIYRGKGKDERTYWRQRVDEGEPKLKEQELVEIIGNAIQNKEKY